MFWSVHNHNNHSSKKNNNKDNGVDDDGDGKIDCRDRADCGRFPECRRRHGGDRGRD